MKLPAFALVTLLAGGLTAPAGPDSVVVFNEVHYHPATNEAALEWVELHNQMAVDIDLSAWFLAGEVAYTFTEGTIIPGGGYLVVASNPSVLQLASSITNALGPFTGRLNNSSGNLQLRDRNGRLMDELEYRDSDKWPVAPDGSGATLVKRDPDSASGPPENWTSSVLVGGTPGRPNFPRPTPAQSRVLVATDAIWRYEASGTDLGAAWREPGFDDSGWAGSNEAKLISHWPFDGNAAATRGVNGTVVGGVRATTDRNGVAGGALAFSGGAQQNVQVAGGGGLNGAVAGTISMWVKWSGTQDADCCGTFGAVLARQANGVFSDNIIALNNANPNIARVVWRQSGGPAPALITGTTNVGTNWHHVAVTFAAGGSTLYLDGARQGSAIGNALNNNPATPLSMGAWIGDGAGFATASIDDVAILDRPLTAAQVAQLAAQTLAPLDFAQNAVYFAGDGRLASNDELRQTPLPLGPTTYYFRNTFQFLDDPARAELKLDLAVDDGAVFYLNGAEWYRHNMPAGATSYSMLAASEVGDAPFLSGISLPTAGLVRGTNVLAVEVHQASALDAGMVFGAGLTATIASESIDPSAFTPGDLVFNEVTGTNAAGFQVELINRGAQPLEVGGYVLARIGEAADSEYVLPAQTLEPGEFLGLSQAMLGFGAAPGDKLFLFRPGKSAVADAIEMDTEPRGRWPDGTGEWLFPNTATFGASNSFVFHDDVVINEIMYHAPPTLEVPAVFGTNVFITLTNPWRYEQSGVDLGTAWRLPGFDDSVWPLGSALLGVTTNNLAVPKNTELALGPTTYYFRASFLYTGAPPVLSLSLRHIVDDGVVLYLNGSEVTRFNMPAGSVRYTNFAQSTIVNATLRTPVTVSLTNLALGTNVLAAEVHQAANSGGDVAFGAELAAMVEAVPRLPFSESPEQWIELFNRGSNAVDLTGWRLDEGIDFRFTNGTMIPSGGYLVIAKDPEALRAKFPEIAIVGPFTNRLSHRGERLVLKDAADNPADVVHYFDGGRWPGAPDGGGASLELRNPFADNSAAEAWAASDERSRSSWQTYSYRGVAQASAVGPDGQWREFVLGLLDDSEMLLDDISVLETPATTPVQLIQNGTFETGTNKWRLIGNHRHSEVIDDPDQPGNKVLRLVARGGTEHMSNHAETTLANNRDTVNGREYEISFRAKWISGNRQLHTRLYFNRLPRTTLLPAPALHGTPGAPNSTSVPNLGPTYRDFRHDPAVPAPFAPITVSVAADDPDGVASMALWSSVNNGPWSSAPMTAEGDGRYSGELLGRAAGTIIQFYVQGTDTLNASSTFPAAGPDSRALCKVDDGRAATNGLHNLRLIVRADDANYLHATVNLMSNDRLGCTMIYDEREIFYDVGLRLKGSEHSRTTTPRLGFNVNLGSDHLFRGVHRELGIDRSESVGFGQREMLIHQTGNHAGGLPTKYSDLIQLMAPRTEHTGSAELQLARYGDVFLDAQFDQGSDGMLFEYELVYQLNSTDTGTPEGNKVPAPDSVTGTSIRNLGFDKEAYRWNFLIKNNEDRDDYNRLIAFCQWMALSGASFTSQIGNYIDVDQWLRAFALCTLSGMGDNYGGDGAQHNLMLYVRPDDARVLFFPHDVDAFFDATRSLASDSNGDLGKLMTVPVNARAYYSHLLDIIATTYNSAYLTRWANHYGRLLPGQNFASHLSAHVQRANFVTSQVNARVPNVAFAITTSGGNNFSTNNNVITLTGTAPLNVKAIEVNGISYPITWTSTTAWSLRIPLLNGPNALTVQGVDRTGLRPTNRVDTITITNTGSGAPLPVVINEWMADNAGPLGYADPVDGLFQDWFELFNPNTNAVNLTGFFLTDNLSQSTKWKVPTNTVIAPRGFLLVWADNQTNQNALDPNGHLHAGFQLNNGGEAIGLFAPDGAPQHTVAFGQQLQNVSQGLFPDGDTNGVYFMTNWTPRAPNFLAEPFRITEISFDGVSVRLTWTALPGHTYRLLFTDSLTAPNWQARGPDIPATAQTASATDLVGPGGQRIYRVVRLD